MSRVDAAHDHVAVEAGRHDVGRGVEDPCLVEHRREWNAGPARDPDCSELPLGSRRRCSLLGAEEAAAVAGAFDGGVDRLLRQALQLVVGEGDRVREGRRAVEARAEDVQLPAGGVDDRCSRVVADEEALVRYLVPEPLHGVPAHLGVGAEVREPLSREWFRDRRAVVGSSRARRPRNRRRCEPREARKHGQAKRAQLQKLAPRQPVLALQVEQELLGPRCGIDLLVLESLAGHDPSSSPMNVDRED